MIPHRRRRKQQQKQQQQQQQNKTEIVAGLIWFLRNSVVVDCDRLIRESTKTIVLILSS